MLYWFLLAGNDPEELKKCFSDFYLKHESPEGMALWRWKKTCWICAREQYRDELNFAFQKFGIIEFSSAPSPSDIEFLCGDKFSLNNSDKKV